MEVAGDPRAGHDPDLDRREAQSRLFDQLLDALSRMGTERPTAVVLEDVQAADPATRDLISFLLNNFRDERVLLILTFRTEHLPRGHSLLGWIADLGRHPRTTMLTLEPLTPSETSMQVDAILGASADGQLAKRIHERSGGNPLFTEELVSAAGSGSATLPDAALRDAPRQGAGAAGAERRGACGRRRSSVARSTRGCSRRSSGERRATT